MSGHRWGRSQKYHARTRTLYALIFPGGFCYIGQSVDVVAREKQHRRPQGGWAGKRFSCQVLGTIEGTEADAVEYEHAWRLKAWQNGWKVYAKPPGLVCNPRNQATPYRRELAKSLRWPITTARPRHLLTTLVKWTIGASLLLWVLRLVTG